MTPPHPAPSIRPIAAALVLASGVLLAIGTWFYQVQKSAVQGAAASGLLAVADLKARQIIAWRRERVADAALVRATPYAARRALDFIARPDSATTRSMFTSWLDRFLVDHTYRRAVLFDSEFRVRLMHPPEASDLVCEGLETPVREAIRTREVVVTDLHLGPGPGQPHIGLVVPFVVRREGTNDAVPAAGLPPSPSDRTAAVLVLEVDARDHLYPELQSWPGAYTTARTLLVRREGNAAIPLSPLHDPASTNSAPPPYHAPITDTDTPAVMAALGRRGVVRGHDDTGADVLAAIRAIPDSTWILVAQVKASEVFATWRERSRLLLALIAVTLATTAGAGAGFALSRERAHYRALYRAELDHLATERIHAITLQSIADAVITTDPEGCVRMFNTTAEALTGWCARDAHGQPLRRVLQLRSSTSGLPIEVSVQRVLREGTMGELDNHTLLISQDGAERPIASTAAPIRDIDGALLGLVFVLRDQSDSRRAQAELAQSETRLRLLMDTMPVAVIVTRLPGYTAEYLNPKATQLFGVDLETVLGQPTLRFYADADVATGIRTQLEAHGLVESDEVRFRRSDGKPFWGVISAVLTTDGGGRIVLSAVRDVTEQKRAQDTVLQSEERLRRAVVDSPFPVMIHAEDGEVLQLSHTWCDLTGYSRAELATIEQWTERAYGERKRAIRDDIDALYGLNQRKYEGDFPIRTRDGGTRIWEFSSAPLGRLPDGRRLVISMALDVTERRRDEAHLRHALAEQTALLKEVHHRVKNNLQIVASLLSLQARQVKNEVALATLRDTQGRIRAMALLHETLHRQGSSARANAALYFGTLCHHLSQSLGAAHRHIEVETRLATIDLDLDQAIPCGLIVNELVSNAFKHAFPDGRPGHLLIEFGSIDSQTVRLIVSDDGVGLPLGADPAHADTLGLRLIAGLAQQIGGTLETVGGTGATFRLTFSRSGSTAKNLP